MLVIVRVQILEPIQGGCIRVQHLLDVTALVEHIVRLHFQERPIHMSGLLTPCLGQEMALFRVMFVIGNTYVFFLLYYGLYRTCD